jgi:thymidine phosphorylase
LQLAGQVGLVVHQVDASGSAVILKVANGEALERFRVNVECQGGDATVCDDAEKLLNKQVTRYEIRAPHAGFVTSIDPLAIGNALSEAGGGRVKADDRIDHAIGYECVALLGDKLAEGVTIGVLFCRDDERSCVAREKITRAYTFEDSRPDIPPLVHAVIPE